MKKLGVITATVSTLLLSACTTVITTDDPVEKRGDLKHICLKESKNPRLKEFIPSMAKSLEKRGFTTEINIEKPAAHCKYMINYALNTRNGVVTRATVQMQELDGNDYDRIGEIVYKQRGDEEQAIVRQGGVQAQTDRIVKELFKNY